MHEKRAFPQKRRANRGGADEALGWQAFCRHAVGGIEREPWLPVRHGRTLFRCCWYHKSAGREHPSVLRRYRGPLRGLRRSARGTAVSGAVRQPLYRLPAAGGASGQNFYQAPGTMSCQAGKPAKGQPSHHDHGGHRNAGGVLRPHRFPRLHRRACILGGDGRHRPCCKLVSVPDRGGGLSVHWRSAAPVFLPPHG